LALAPNAGHRHSLFLAVNRSLLTPALTLRRASAVRTVIELYEFDANTRLGYVPIGDPFISEYCGPHAMLRCVE
jgi:hypothetical protein